MEIALKYDIHSGYFSRKMLGTRYGPDLSDSRDPNNTLKITCIQWFRALCKIGILRNTVRFIGVIHLDQLRRIS